ncbi:hypothetical protein CN211_27875 [Sinorhizobium meliloti]|nr:hypothetical protein CN211_27875 [Sinorhizobium meliloti]
MIADVVACGIVSRASSDIIAIASLLGSVQESALQALARAAGEFSQQANQLKRIIARGAPFTSAIRSPTRKAVL